jgi:hypothetical protein
MLPKRATRDELLAQIGERNRRYAVGTAVRTQIYPIVSTGCVPRR